MTAILSDFAPMVMRRPAVRERPERDNERLVSALAERLSRPEPLSGINEARALAGQMLGRKVEAGSLDAKRVDEAVERAVLSLSLDIVRSGRERGAEDVSIFRALVELYLRQPRLTVRTSASVACQAYSTPVPIAFLVSRLAGIGPGLTVYEPAAGNGALLMEADAALARANELDHVRADYLRSRGYRVTEYDAARHGPEFRADRVIANPPFGGVKEADGRDRIFSFGDFQTRELDQIISLRALESLQDDGRAAVVIGGKEGQGEDRRRRYRTANQTGFYRTLFKRFKVAGHYSLDGGLYERQGAGYPIDILVIAGRGETANPTYPGGRPPRLFQGFEELEELLAGGKDAGTRSRARPAAVSVTAVTVKPADVYVTSLAAQLPAPAVTPVLTAPAAVSAIIKPPAVSAPPCTPANPAPVVPRETERQKPYRPASRLPSLGTLSPRHMAAAAEAALARVRGVRGEVDKFVAEELGFSLEKMASRFSAEQADALALAIHNIRDGKGFILGDAAGVGKGRVNAGIIHWAGRRGHIPVFVSRDVKLYAAMAVDLADIGLPDFKPLPTNAGLSPITLPDGRQLATGGTLAHRRLLDRAAEKGLGEYGAVFTTYDQLKGESWRRDFIRRIAPRAVFVLDEAHEAGGEAEAAHLREDGSRAAANLAHFLQAVQELSPHGALYSSATYAKRPDNLALYRKTDMWAAAGGKNLVRAIQLGGVPLQQAVAAQLAESGQYIRRERGYEGVEMGSRIAAIDAGFAEMSSRFFQAILGFDRLKRGALEKIDAALAGRGERGKGRDAWRAESSHFAAVMHNVISQMSLAQKLEPIIAETERAVRNGEKAVIALANTMGSFIGRKARAEGLVPGQEIKASFRDILRGYLEQSRILEIIPPGGKAGDAGNESLRLTDEELGERAVRTYREAEEILEEAGWDIMPISPVDYLKDRLAKRGIRAGEITGRSEGAAYSGSVPVYRRIYNSQAEGMRAQTAFNNGDLDVLVINEAGSTGISLHASEKFRDQRKRRLLIAQPQLDVNKYIQTLGRVHRTGQTTPPAISLVFTSLPSERRPAAVLAKKLASLSANTTADARSEASFQDIPDFMNAYGDITARRFLEENPDVGEALGFSYLDSGEMALGQGGGKNLMARLTGRLPALPVARQEEIYRELEAEYQALVEMRRAAGSCELEAESLPLDARLLESRELLSPLPGNDSPFAAGARVGRYDVRRLGKPYSAARVLELVKTGQLESDTVESARRRMQAWAKERLAKIRSLNLEPDRERDRLCEVRRRADQSLAAVEGVLQAFRPGGQVKVENEAGMAYEGVVIGLGAGGGKSPVSLSAWRLKIALADAARRLEIPFSELADFNPEPGAVRLSATDFDLAEKFDRSRSQSRVFANIVVGNLLRAHGWLADAGVRARVVNFTDSDGCSRPGLLLGDASEEAFRNLAAPGETTLTPDQAVKRLEEGCPDAEVRSADKLLSVRRERSGYSLSVPASRRAGGVYYLNPRLLAAIGRDFVKSGDRMLAGRLSRERVLAGLEALRDEGIRLAA